MNRHGLLEWQPDAVEKILAALDKWGGALDGSDMGVGKTAHAVAAIRERDVPTLVVCPAVSVSSWRRMGDHLGTKFSIINYEMLRTGNTDFGRWEHPKPARLERVIVCESCQMKLDFTRFIRCPHHHLGIHCITTKVKPHSYGKFIFNSAVKQLVFDEVHRCSGLDSLQADNLLAAKRQGIPTLGLSATPAESPLDFRALGYLLGLHRLIGPQSFMSWAFARGVRKHPMGGLHFAAGEERKKEIMAGINAELFPERGARVRIDDLGLAFPEVQIRPELYDLDGAGKLDELYAAMDDAIRLLNQRGELDRSPDHPLTQLLRAREKIELLTVPIYEQLVADAKRQGFHVAIFVNFRSTVEELCKRLKTQCRVDGSQVGSRGAVERANNVERFQRDEEPVIVLTIAAGGVSISLHDVLGKFPRLGLVAPGLSAVQFRQVFGRLRRATGKSKALYRIILIAGTVQEKIHKAMQGKLNCIDALNDGDLWAANLPVTVGNVAELFPQQ